MTLAEIGQLAIAEGRAYRAAIRAATEWDAASADCRRLDAGMRSTHEAWLEAKAVLRTAVQARLEVEQVPSLERIRAIREGRV